MKILYHKSLLVAALFSGLSAHAAAGFWPDGAPVAQKMFMCTEVGSAQPQFLAWTDADQQLIGISALRQDVKAPSEMNGMQRTNAQDGLGVRTVKAGYHIVNADKQTNGTLVVSGTRYGCVPSFDD